MVFESYEIHFFCFVIRISISLRVLMLTNIFSLRILLLAVENVW